MLSRPNPSAKSPAMLLLSYPMCLSALPSELVASDIRSFKEGNMDSRGVGDRAEFFSVQDGGVSRPPCPLVYDRRTPRAGATADMREGQKIHWVGGRYSEKAELKKLQSTDSACPSSRSHSHQRMPADWVAFHRHAEQGSLDLREANGERK